MSTEPDDGYVRITLRMPRDLHQLLTQQADERSTSMNAEIVQRLRQSFESGRLPPSRAEVVADAKAHASVLMLHDALFYNMARVLKVPMDDAVQKRLDSIIDRWGAHPAFLELIERPESL